MVGRGVLAREGVSGARVPGVRTADGRSVVGAVSQRARGQARTRRIERRSLLESGNRIGLNCNDVENELGVIAIYGKNHAVDQTVLCRLDCANSKQAAMMSKQLESSLGSM